MTLSLYVDTDRWRTHQRTLLAEFPALVPVAKGNGYGFGNLRLAREAELLGTGMLAVGTATEATEVLRDSERAGGYQGDVLVLTPYRIGEEPPQAPATAVPAAPPADGRGRVVRTVASVEALAALAGHRVVVECMTSMRRHGIAPAELDYLAEATGQGGAAATVEGFALHLPLDRPDPVAEVAAWIDAIAGAGLPTGTVYLSHLSSAGVTALRAAHPRVEFRSRIGTRLWLGDVGALSAGATVLDVTALAKGERYGYRQHRAPSDGHLLVVCGGTAHGIGLESPKYVRGLLPRAKGIARAGLATLNRTLSPYQWNGRQLWFAEPPHMQVSILFLPAGSKPPAVGDELALTVRHTTTHFDQVADRTA
ncbi:alanine racemase [Kitasatospora sp. GAS204B]|uniref:alanine racemase n=1 Tax=unclassified Kitasatospora TaxID=2633591 RepID=UPI00247627E3|nr:alanine racemase [Kitasatospora sp. GAS204B]MDH6119688.1 hypothetical protein [Kitasatospora sp. GAS204B]